ncbi:hypothetical protein [Olivibacter sp. XZL3]|uniref:hypothetical protein n=1 Tax=Olivibacter sp. XZL3 TaxID=1735116 RepID=UPI001065BA0C|nr:hypothetical protein [Olivibacter sp. XZL3]
MKKNTFSFLLAFPVFIFIYAVLTDDKHTEGQTYAYFVLASVFTLLIALLPRLKELSVNEKGLSVKLLDEISKKVAEVEALTNPVHKASLARDKDFDQELNEKIRALKERIDAYKIVITRD